jgi:hypothetical protein
VIGVEFSNRLHRIAEVNIAHFARHHLMKTMPRSVNMDASKFDLWPSGDRVVFCANPFAPQLMKTILDKLKASALESRIQTILIYLTPMPNETANCLGAFPLIGRGRWLSDLGGFQKYLIYRIG